MTGRAAAKDPSGVVWLPVLVLASTKAIFALVTSGVLGLHRDEYYYLASGRHLEWGYVDNPPLVPWIYRLVDATAGHSPLALAVVPAFCGAMYIVVAAGLAAEAGGGRPAQVLAATAAWLGPVYLTTSHFLSTVDLELLAAGVATWLVLRLHHGGDRRLWLAVGAVLGVGLLGKYTLALWAITGVIGLAVTDRPTLRSPWVLVGAVLALVITAPSLVWQAQHHWAIWTFTRNLAANNGTTDRIQFVPLQLGIVTLAGTIVWVAGLRHAWSEQHRWIPLGFALSALILLVTGGKAYYLADWYLPLLALGGVRITRWWSSAAQRRMLAGVVITGVVSLPIFTPVLPTGATTALGLQKVNNDLGAMLGWHHIAEQVAAAYHDLPAAEQTGAVILTSDYSEAGAINLYGRALDLPTAISGHNTYWIWGYGHPAPDAVTVAVGIDPALLHRGWGTVTTLGTLGRSGPPIDPQEVGTVIYLCRHQRGTWKEIWPLLRHYD